MDYVKQLVNLVVKLTKKVNVLKSELKDLQEAQDSDELYYAKYQKAKAENLELENKIASLELTIQSNNFELEKRNRLLIQNNIRI